VPTKEKAGERSPRCDQVPVLLTRGRGSGHSCRAAGLSPPRLPSTCCDAIARHWAVGGVSKWTTARGRCNRISSA